MNVSTPCPTGQVWVPLGSIEDSVNPMSLLDPFVYRLYLGQVTKGRCISAALLPSNSRFVVNPVPAGPSKTVPPFEQIPRGQFPGPGGFFPQPPSNPAERIPNVPGASTRVPNVPPQSQVPNIPPGQSPNVPSPIVVVPPIAEPPPILGPPSPSNDVVLPGTPTHLEQALTFAILTSPAWLTLGILYWREKYS